MAIITTFIATAFFVGCGHSDPYSAVVDVDLSRGVYPIRLKYDNRDTTQFRNIDIIARGVTTTRHERKSLLIRTISPSGLFTEDSVSYTLPNSGSLNREYAIPYRRDARFGEYGQYTFELRPTRPAADINALGIKLTNI